MHMICPNKYFLNQKRYILQTTFNQSSRQDTMLLTEMKYNVKFASGKGRDTK